MRRLVLAIASLVLPPCVSAGVFVSLDLPGSQVVAVSSDGCVVAGSLLGAGSGGFRWSAAQGTRRLDGAVAVQGVSPSGDYVAGSVLDDLQREVASYWDADGVVHVLAAMPDIETIGVISQATAVTDEPRVVGSARRPARGSVAFEWTQADGMRALPLLHGDASSSAVGISHDGQRVLGWERTGGVTHGVLWGRSRAASLVVASDQPVAGEVLGSNRRGDVLVGVLDAAMPDAGEAYRWSEAAGTQVLSQSGVSTTRFYASSDDGHVLVGSSGQGDRREAWLWLEASGAVALPALLAQRGIAIPPQWTPMMLTAVSGDGHRLAGWGKHGGVLDSFLIDLAPRDGAAACPAAVRPAAAVTAATP
jgi:uncharacterized membrane protein